MSRKPSLRETILLRALETIGVGVWLWAAHDFLVWQPSGLIFDYPEKAILLAFLASSLLLVCLVLRCVLSAPSILEQFEVVTIMVMALWFPGYFACCCLGFFVR
jgi:hypothetical protein